MKLYNYLTSQKFRNSYMYLFLISLAIDGIWLIPALLIHFNRSKWGLWLLYIPVMAVSYYAVMFIEKKLKKKHGEK